jgi:hypothetical protein
MHTFPGLHKRGNPHLSDRAGVSQQQSTLVASLPSLVTAKITRQTVWERGLCGIT